jgi:hypothetical protein
MHPQQLTFTKFFCHAAYSAKATPTPWEYVSDATSLHAPKVAATFGKLDFDLAVLPGKAPGLPSQ